MVQKHWVPKVECRIKVPRKTHKVVLFKQKYLHFCKKFRIFERFLNVRINTRASTVDSTIKRFYHFCKVSAMFVLFRFLTDGLVNGKRNIPTNMLEVEMLY